MQIICKPMVEADGPSSVNGEWIGCASSIASMSFLTEPLIPAIYSDTIFQVNSTGIYELSALPIAVAVAGRLLPPIPTILRSTALVVITSA
jgi:hypothetical protein